MATVKGTWRFNETLTPINFAEPDVNAIIQEANYRITNYVITSQEDQNFIGFMYLHANYGPGDTRNVLGFSFRTSSYQAQLYAYSVDGVATNKWLDWDTQTFIRVDPIILDFGEAEQEVSDEFYAWFTANATPQAKTKVFKRLYSGDTVATSGTRVFKKLTTEEPIVGGYLTFSSPSAFTLKTYNSTKNWDGKLEYSTDTKTWNEWGGTTISADSGVLYMRGTGNTKITGKTPDGSTKYRWVLSGAGVACEGNIENLLDYVAVANGEHPLMAEYCYNYIFHSCTNLTTAPALPATTLAKNCYDMMFGVCTSLTTAPALPATTLAENCYNSMFYGCTSLTTAPALPATTLAERCYYYMFSGCTAIKLSTTKTGEYQTPYRIPTSGTGKTATDALSYMFYSTGGAFTGTPSINTTYYTSNTVV